MKENPSCHTFARTVGYKIAQLRSLDALYDERRKVDPALVLKVRYESMQLDEAGTRRQYGYASVDAYYAAADVDTAFRARLLPQLRASSDRERGEFGEDALQALRALLPGALADSALLADELELVFEFPVPERPLSHEAALSEVILMGDINGAASQGAVGLATKLAYTRGGRCGGGLP